MATILKCDTCDAMSPDAKGLHEANHWSTVHVEASYGPNRGTDKYLICTDCMRKGVVLSVRRISALQVAPPACATSEDVRDALRYRVLRLPGFSPFGVVDQDMSPIEGERVDELVDARIYAHDDTAGIWHLSTEVPRCPAWATRVESEPLGNYLASQSVLLSPVSIGVDPANDGDKTAYCVVICGELDAGLNKLVDTFLAWPLPDSVACDPCATTPAYPNRVGTNLLAAHEAKLMLQHVLGLPINPEQARG